MTGEEGTPTAPWLSTSGLHGALPKSSQPITHLAHHGSIKDIFAVFALPPSFLFAWGLNKKDKMSRWIPTAKSVGARTDRESGRDVFYGLSHVASRGFADQDYRSSTHRLKGVYNCENLLHLLAL